MKLHTGPLNFLDDALSDGTDASSSRMFSFIAVVNALGVVWVPLAVWAIKAINGGPLAYDASLIAAQGTLAGILLGPTLLAQYGAKREETKAVDPAAPVS